MGDVTQRADCALAPPAPRAQRRGGRRYFVIDANSVAGRKTLDRETPGAAGARCVTMIDAFGGARPTPSCATARVVAVDAMTRRVAIAYLMMIFLGCSSARRGRREHAVRRPHRRISFPWEGAASGICRGSRSTLTLTYIMSMDRVFAETRAPQGTGRTKPDAGVMQ